MATLTVAGTEITDATRVAALGGDGRAAEGSYGIWEAATNLVTNGGFEADTTSAAPATWVALSSVLSVQVTGLATVKFGSKAMRVITSNLVANEGAYIPFTGAAGTYTGSVWVAGPAGGTVQVGIQDNGIIRTVSAPVTLTGTPQRITVTATTLTATAPRLYVQTNVKQSITFSVDGAQVEARSFATPYIETTTATVTRAGARVQALGSYLSEVQSWFAMRVRWTVGPNGTSQMLFNWEDSATPVNRIRVFNNGTIYAVQHVRNSVTGTGVTITNTPTVGSMATVVVAWTATTISLSINGGSFVNQSRSAAGGAAMAANFDIANYGAALQLDGDVLWFIGGSGTLTDGDAWVLNTYANTDPVVGPQYLGGGTAYPTILWTARNATYNQGGPDPGFGYADVKGYYDLHPDVNNYSDLRDASARPIPGTWYNLSTEVENNTGAAFSPQVGVAGQAYAIGSRFTTPRSPMMYDLVSGGRAQNPTPYVAYLREDLSTFQPFNTGAFHWLGLTDYMDKGGGGVFYGYVNNGSTTVHWLTSSISSGTTAPGTGTIAASNVYRAILGFLVTYPVFNVASVAVLTGGTGFTNGAAAVFSGGSGAQATGHIVTTGNIITGVVVDTPGSYTAGNPPTTVTVAGGSGATFSITMQTVQFFGAVDWNLFISTSTPAFPKDAIYAAATSPVENFVRAAVQPAGPAWYGFVSCDAAFYSGNLAVNVAATTHGVGLNTVMTYLTTTNDQKVGAVNPSTPNPASTTPYFPKPKNGMISALLKGFNYAIEGRAPAYGQPMVIDFSISNMHLDY